MKPGIDYIGVGVGALIINNEKKFLLALRSQHAKNERGKWEIPGGAVEFGETFEEALHREIREELGIKIQIGELVGITSHILLDECQHWVSPTYFCTVIDGIPSIMEPEKCDQLGWFSINEARNLPLSLITLNDINNAEKKQKL